MPGVEGFDVQDDRHWSAKVKVPLGLGGLRMSINFEKTEERELEFARLHAKGTGVGALMDMNTGVPPQRGGRGHGDALGGRRSKIAGPVGSMGQRVLQPIVNQQVKNVLDALDKQVTQAAAGRAGTPEPSALRSRRRSRAEGLGPPAEGADPGARAGPTRGSAAERGGLLGRPPGPTQTA